MSQPSTIQQLNSLSPCDLADALPREQFMHIDIRPLWQPMPRIAGRAFCVDCPPGDHLMLHAAIYQAQAGDIIVAKGDTNFALAGGNVCAIAQRRGIVGFVVDGVIRDLAEVREMQFPVFARGVHPKPGAKKCITPVNQTVECGGVQVNPGDIVVADEEGIAVVPKDQAEDAYQVGKKRANSDASMSLEEWQAQHQQKVQSCLDKLGY